MQCLPEGENSKMMYKVKPENVSKRKRKNPTKSMKENPKELNVCYTVLRSRV